MFRFLHPIVGIGLRSGSASPPVGVLAPVEAAALGATRVDILVATTRAPSQDEGVLFSAERGARSMANVVVSIPPDEGRQIARVK